MRHCFASKPSGTARRSLASIRAGAGMATCRMRAFAGADGFARRGDASRRGHCRRRDIRAMPASSRRLRRSRAGKIVALANKETIVCAGELVMRGSRSERGHRLRPVDSEHSALWQCLETARPGAEPDAHHPHCVRWPVPHRADGAVARDDRRRCAQAPDVEHGQQNHDRLRDADEQGIGDRSRRTGSSICRTSRSMSSSIRRASCIRISNMRMAR